jgi:fructose-1,6-bisphosphatase I
MEERNKTLGEFIIENQNAFQYSSGELSRIINSIRLAAKVVNYKVNKAGLVDIVKRRRTKHTRRRPTKIRCLCQ